MADLLTHLRDHLVAQGLVRRPDETMPAGAPPLWLEPRDGVPAPGEGQNPTERGPDVVLGAFRGGGIPARPFESSLREDVVEIRIRARLAPMASAIEAQLRPALIDRRNFQLGAETVIDCEEWRALQPLGAGRQGFTYVWSLIFQRYAG